MYINLNKRESLPGGYESILIPDSGTWMITLWHFGVDSPNYKEVNTCITWKDAQGVLLREYNKKKEGKLRKEKQEHPKISLAEVAKMMMNAETNHSQGTLPASASFDMVVSIYLRGLQ